MSHIEDRWKRPERRGKGKRWKARYVAPDGWERSQHFERKADAERFLAGINNDIARGAYLDPNAGRVPFDDFARQWLANQVHIRTATRLLYTAHIDNHLIPGLGRTPLSAVRRADVQALMLDVSERVKPSTTRTVYAVLRSIFSSALKDDLLVKTPCIAISLPAVVRRRIIPLTPTQVIAVESKLPQWLRITVWLGAQAGLRESEALGLAVDRIDFLRRRFTVDQQLQSHSGATPVLGPPKTDAGIRVVPIDQGLLVRLTEQIRKYPDYEHGFLIGNRYGHPVRRSAFAMAWRKAVTAAGLPEGTRFHDLRHTYASTLIAAGVHPKVIQIRLGHASITETMDTYGHLFPEAEEAGRGAIDAAYAEAEAEAEEAARASEEDSSTAQPRPNDEDEAAS